MSYLGARREAALLHVVRGSRGKPLGVGLATRLDRIHREWGGVSLEGETGHKVQHRLQFSLARYHRSGNSYQRLICATGLSLNTFRYYSFLTKEPAHTTLR